MTSIYQPGELSSLGVQPTTDTHIQCLECGRWYRALGRHIDATHQVTAEQYKERHGLSVTKGLVSPELSRRHTEAGQARYESDASMREAFARRRAENAHNWKAGDAQAAHTAATRKAAARPQNRAIMSESIAQAHARDRARMKRDLNDRAVALGHVDLGAYLTATRPIAAAVVATELGAYKSTVERLRRELLGPAPRVGGIHRGRLSLEERAAIAAAIASGEFVAAVADQYGVTPKAARYWYRRLAPRSNA